MNLNGARTMDSVSNIRVLHGEVTRLNMNMTIRLGWVDSRQGEQDRRLAAIETKLDALLATLGGSAVSEAVSANMVSAAPLEARLDNVSQREAEGLSEFLAQRPDM